MARTRWLLTGGLTIDAEGENDSDDGRAKVKRGDEPRYGRPFGCGGADREEGPDAEVVDDESDRIARSTARVPSNTSPGYPERECSDSEHSGDKESMSTQRGVE